MVEGGTSDIGEKTLYLAGPDGRDEVSAVLEHIEDLYDASRVAKHGDAGVGHGQVKGQVVCGLQRCLLPEQDEEHNAVPEPGQPPCRSGQGDRGAWVSFSHSILHSFIHSSPADCGC